VSNREIEFKICRLVEEVIARGSGRTVHVGVDDRLLDDGLIDSLTMIKLLLGLKDLFGLEVPGSEVSEDNFGSVAGITRVVLSHMGTGVAR
jgi:acyl carrier protein